MNDKPFGPSPDPTIDLARAYQMLQQPGYIVRLNSEDRVWAIEETGEGTRMIVRSLDTGDYYLHQFEDGDRLDCVRHSKDGLTWRLYCYPGRIEIRVESEFELDEVRRYAALTYRAERSRLAPGWTRDILIKSPVVSFTLDQSIDVQGAINTVRLIGLDLRAMPIPAFMNEWI